MKRLAKVLLVHWEDITEAGGWHMADGAEEESVAPAQCYSTGIRVKETKDYLYIAGTFGQISRSDPQWGTLSVIPKGCIKSVKTVKVFEIGRND